MATIQDSKLDLLLTPRVPHGLAAAVEGLTREVIRHRPENIYVFAAHHFEKLLRLREQYGENVVNKKNMKLLRDINDAVKERCVYLESKESKDFLRRSGLFLNETSKVLEKHESNFGEISQKISNDEIDEFQEVSNPILISPKIQTSRPKEKYETHRAENKNRMEKYAIATTSKKRESPAHHSQDSSSISKSNSKSAPKIIPQIPLAKDIKTELKRYRISSRERKKVIEEKKMQVAGEYSKETVCEKSFKRSVEKMRKSLETWSEEKKNLRTEDRMKRRGDTTKDKLESPRMRKSSRPMKMDEVKNYVIQNFVGMTSLDDLQTPSYVEKVQEVINETSMVIKEKVEALKTGIIKAARAKQLKSENSSSNDDYLKTSSKSEGDNRSIEGNLLESSSYQTPSKSSESSKFAQENSEISETFNNDKNCLDRPRTKISDILHDLNESNISLPVVRSPSSKSTSRSLSARSDSDDLVLPPISPESNKSTKVIEELVLPVLSSPRSTSLTPDSINYNEKIVNRNQVNNEEEFQDSLNVTPDLIDTTQRPDSLETSEIVDKSDSSVRLSPLETLKGKLLEIEEAQKQIGDVLDDAKASNDKISEKKKKDDKNTVTSKIQDKLLEIEESEKRIERILDFQSTIVKEPEITNADIKSKLQELEDTEKRIEDTLSAQINDNLKKKNTLRTEINRIVSPHSYVLTEGSPYDIPDSVTTVIIPDRSISPDSDNIQVKLEDGETFSTLLSSKESTTQIEDHLNESQKEQNISMYDAFGEVVDISNIDISTVDVEYIRSIKVNHDIMLNRQDLDLIQEECDKEVNVAESIDSEDEKVLKVVTSSLEEILEKDKVKHESKEEVQTVIKNYCEKGINSYLPEAIQYITEYESTDETKETSITDGFGEYTEIIENSLDIEDVTGRSAESTNEIKETSVNTDRSSLSFDPVVPIVPELNLDSLPDLTISSFNITDDEQKEENKNEMNNSNSLEVFVSSIGTKEFTTEADVKEIESNYVNITETTNKNSFLKSEEISSEFICVENTERIEREEYEKAHESLKFNEFNAMKDREISEETSINEEENIRNDSEEQIKLQDDIIAGTSLISDIKNMVEHTSDRISNSYDKNNASNETSMPSEDPSNLLTHFNENAELSLREFENAPLHIERDCLHGIDTDQSNQFIDRSSQCTKQLDSDDLLMETSTDNTIKKSHIKNTTAIQEEQTIADKTFNNNLQVSDATTVVEEVENGATDEKKSCHIYVPEMSISKDTSLSTASSTFMSAATKIQAGVRGFLTRRRLQSSQHRSSTLDGVPSIEEHYAADHSIPSTKSALPSSSSTSSSSCLMPIVETVSSISEFKDRKKLRREDAVQRTTLSLENAFADNQVQHTGEFHDCIPLPIFDTGAFSFKKANEQERRDAGNNCHSNNSDNSRNSRQECLDVAGEESKERNDKETIISHGETLNRTKSSNVEPFLGKIFATSTTNLSGALKLGQFVDVVLLPGDSETMLQSRYLNFITSVEDIPSDSFNDSLVLPNSPEGAIIKEITSLDEDKNKTLESTSDRENNNTTSEAIANETKNNNKSSSVELQCQNAQEKSKNCTSNIAEITENQISDEKLERSAENSIKISHVEALEADVEALDTESSEESGLVEEKLDKDKNIFSCYEETENEIPQVQETLSLVDALISIHDEHASLNIEEVLGLGDEGDNLRKADRIILKSTVTDLLRFTRVSQESHLSDERVRSPLTMTQLAPERIEESFEKSERSENEGNESPISDGANQLSLEVNSPLARKENSIAQEKESESLDINDVEPYGSRDSIEDLPIGPAFSASRHFSGWRSRWGRIGAAFGGRSRDACASLRQVDRERGDSAIGGIQCASASRECRWRSRWCVSRTRTKPRPRYRRASVDIACASGSRRSAERRRSNERRQGRRDRSSNVTWKSHGTPLRTSPRRRSRPVCEASWSESGSRRRGPRPRGSRRASAALGRGSFSNRIDSEPRARYPEDDSARHLRRHSSRARTWSPLRVSPFPPVGVFKSRDH